MAYVLLCALRRIGLHDTDFAKATFGTIRLKLLKIGAIVRLSVRRIKIAMASACPAAQDWARAAIRLAIAALVLLCQHPEPRRDAAPSPGSPRSNLCGPRSPEMSQPPLRLQTHGTLCLQKYKQSFSKIRQARVSKIRQARVV
jgi:hypothetical protein